MPFVSDAIFVVSDLLSTLDFLLSTFTFDSRLLLSTLVAFK